LDLLTAQVRVIDAWARSTRPARDAAEVVGHPARKRVDLGPRMESRRREQAALIARVDQRLRASGQPLFGPGPVRACSLTATKGCQARWRRGSRRTACVIVGVSGDDADAAGAIIAEQAELVILQDRLPSLAGSELVQRVREFPRSASSARTSRTAAAPHR
jgi:hypothetical protein